jgi:NAD(P)H-flavin reductase
MIASEEFQLPDVRNPFRRMSMDRFLARISHISKPITRPIKGLMNRLCSSMSMDLFPAISLWLKIVLAKISLTGERLYTFLDEALDLNPPDVVDLQTWGVCRLAEKEILPGDVFRYRFELESENAVMPLEMGQELQMCVVDEGDNVLKVPVFPVSKTNARGYFDVLTKFGGEAASARFATALSQMGLGDEVAYKGGRYRLNYLGENYPIDSMSFVVSGLGSNAALQIIRNILGTDSTVDDTEMLWVNEERSDFVCDQDWEELEYRHVDKFSVSRIIQADLYGKSLTERDDVKDALTPYSEGRLGVICGPEYVIGKARNLLLKMGYPLEDIVTIVTAA